MPLISSLSMLLAGVAQTAWVFQFAPPRPEKPMLHWSAWVRQAIWSVASIISQPLFAPSDVGTVCVM